jgi:hypothetical protein
VRCRLTAVAVLAALALCMGACGGGNTGAGTAQEPTASAPEATAPPPDATQPGTTAVTPPPQTTPAETEPPTGGNGGASGGTANGGGEQSVRVPAAFVVMAGGRLTPPTITVPPFLAVELSLRSRDGRSHRLVVRTPTPHGLSVTAGGHAAIRIPGLRADRYPVLLDGRRAGALVAGGEVGP